MGEERSQRILKSLGVADLADFLADGLSGSELHSLLLAVLKRRVGKIQPAALSLPHALARASDLDARLMHNLEGLCYETATGFEAVELSPLDPLGTVAALTGLDQGNVLSTIRAFECASDPTLGLAREAARRRQDPTARKEVLRLCSSHRLVRLPTPQKAGMSAHFKLFSLVSAARDRGSFAFETEALREHIGLYLSLLSRLAASDFGFADVSVELSDTRVVAHLCSTFGVGRGEIRTSVRALDSESADRLLAQRAADWPPTTTRPSEELAEFKLPAHLLVQLGLLERAVCDPLSKEHPGISFSFNPRRLTGLGYYEGPCFHLKTRNALGSAFTLGDGGFVKWTQLLLGDQKERLMTSALGTEMICRMFRR